MPNGQISKMLYLIENIFNIYYCEIRFVVFVAMQGVTTLNFTFPQKHGLVTLENL